MGSEIVHKHSFCFNEKDNCGESLILETNFVSNGDNVFLEQRLVLNSYCNSSQINLYGAQITSEKLRELANQLDLAKNKIVVEN